MSTHYNSHEQRLRRLLWAASEYDPDDVQIMSMADPVWLEPDWSASLVNAEVDRLESGAHRTPFFVCPSLPNWSVEHMRAVLDGFHARHGTTDERLVADWERLAYPFSNSPR